MLLKIVQTGEPVLRQEARSLTREEILSPGIQGLIELMRDTMRDAPGVGLAAPQIGQGLKLAVIEDRPEYLAAQSPRDLAALQRTPVPFQVIINPVVRIIDPTPQVFFEGCLSVSGLVGLVPRALAVEVEALNENAEPITLSARGWHARILQHEIDHLYGILCVDRMNLRSLTTQQNLLRYWRGKELPELTAELELDKKV
jgi:peptide deformylase